MKVQVIVTNSNKAAANSTTIDATVGPTDTVLNVQEFIASFTKTFAFPDQKLLFKGKTLPGGQRLSECGVKEGDVLEFLFQASEQTLVKQLSDLLGKQALSPEELGFLYSYRYGASFNDTLKAMGHDGQLGAFLEGQKCFSFQGEKVKIVQEKVVQPPPGLCPIEEDKAHGIIEVNVSVEVHVAGRAPELLPRDEDDDVYLRLESSETVTRTKDIIAAYEQMPFPDRDLMLAEKKLEDGVSLSTAGVKNGSNLVMAVYASEASLASQLEELVWERTGLAPSELGLQYCQRFGTPVAQALRILGLHANLGRFLEGQPRFCLTGGCVTLAGGPKLVTPLSQQEVSYGLEALDHVTDLMRKASFLNIGHVEKGRSVDGQVQATIFVNGLPPSHHELLLKGLQKAVASTLEAMRTDEPSIEHASVVGDVVHVKVEGQTVSVRLTAAPPCFQ